MPLRFGSADPSGEDRTLRKPVPVALVVGELICGGAERVVVDIANKLDRGRFQPLVIMTHTPGPLAGEIDRSVETIALGRSGRVADIGAALRLGRILAARGVRIVHSHNHHVSYFVRVVRMLSRGTWHHIVHDHHGPAVGSIKLDILDRVFLQDVPMYIATSEALRRRARDVFGIPEERVRLLYNGVAVPELRRMRKDKPATIVHVGRLNYVKNPWLAVKTAAILKGFGLEFRWLLVGAAKDGKTEEELRVAIVNEGLEGTMSIAGEISNVREILDQASIGVLTSRFEGLSIAVLEYMAAGLPVVLTDVGETSKVVKRAGGGFVVPQESPGELAAGLARLLRNDTLGYEFGEKNWSYVRAHHSLESMVRELMALYDEVLAGSTTVSFPGANGSSHDASRFDAGAGDVS